MSSTYSFSGEAYSPELDGQRLSTQFDRVLHLMLDGRWRTLAAISAAVKGSEASCSARLRDARKRRFGGFHIARRRVAGERGLWEYRLVLPEPAGQQDLLADVDRENVVPTAVKTPQAPRVEGNTPRDARCHEF